MTGLGSLPVATPRRPGTSQGRCWGGAVASGLTLRGAWPAPLPAPHPWRSRSCSREDWVSHGPQGRLEPPAASCHPRPRALVSSSFSGVCIPGLPGVTLAAFRPAPRLPDVARPPLPPPCLRPKSSPWAWMCQAAPHPQPSAPKSQLP